MRDQVRSRQRPSISTQSNSGERQRAPGGRGGEAARAVGARGERPEPTGPAACGHQAASAQVLGELRDARGRRQVHDPEPFEHHSSLASTWTKQYWPIPPTLWVSPTSARGTCRSPASPRSCFTISHVIDTPVAPTGGPFALSPPSTLTRTPPPPPRPPRAAPSRPPTSPPPPPRRPGALSP